MNARVNRLAAQFWPCGQFRDADRGTALERAAAQRHNRELARALPGCINRWAMLSAVLLTLTQISQARLAQLFGVLFAVSFCGVVHFTQVWAMLRRPR
jgi:hypothetical protein